MTVERNGVRREGLKTARLLMVLSSISPLFILWAIRGNTLVSDRWFIGVCAVLVVLPNIVLWFRFRTAVRQRDTERIVVGAADDHRDHILVYLFAMLLPFYSEAIGTWRDLSATLTALAFIVFLFWHLNLHYMNIFFAALGYRVFTVSSPDDGNPHTSRTRRAVITRRTSLVKGEIILGYRLSDTVFMEIEK